LVDLHNVELGNLAEHYYNTNSLTDKHRLLTSNILNDHFEFVTKNP